MGLGTLVASFGKDLLKDTAESVAQDVAQEVAQGAINTVTNKTKGKKSTTKKSTTKGKGKAMWQNAANMIKDETKVQAEAQLQEKLQGAPGPSQVAPVQEVKVKVEQVNVPPPEYTMQTHAGCTCSCPYVPPKAGQQGGAYDVPDGEDLSVQELKILARIHNIPGRSRMRKFELISALMSIGAVY